MVEGVVEKTKWVHPWKFIKRFKTKEPSDFQNFLRLDATVFDDLLKMITPRIEKRNTAMRDAIPPSQGLSNSCSPSSPIWIAFRHVHGSSWPTANFISSKYHNVGSTTSSAPVPLFFRIFYPLQFFSEVSMQRIKFLNQPIFISNRKSLSIFAKQIFVLFFFSSVAVILALDIPQSR